MAYFLQQILNGLHIGAIYALLSFGYALVNVLLRRTNLAHGAIFGFAGQLMILAAVFGWQVLWLTLSATLIFGGLVALAYSALVSHLLARHVFAPLAERSPNAIVVATLGVSLVLMEVGRLAAETRDFWLPPLLSAPLVFAEVDGFPVTLTHMQLVNCVVAAMMLAAAALFLATSHYGREWRAVGDDPLAAAMCGVDRWSNLRRTVLFGSMLAAVAGGMAALHYGNIGFGAGLIFGLKVLFVAAIGGYSSPAWAAVGGLAFGIAESLWSAYFPIEWRDAWIFLLLVALLVLRPKRPEPDARALTPSKPRP